MVDKGMHAFLSRKTSFFVSSYSIILLLLISESTPHAFLSSLQPKQSSTWLATDIILTRRKLSVSPWLKLRGGADSTYFGDISDGVKKRKPEDPSACVLESTAGASDPSNEYWDESRSMDDDEMIYASIGILDLSMVHSASIILLKYNCKHDAGWGIYEGKFVETRLPNGYDASELAIAEVNGCLCHGIVINLPPQIFQPASTDSKHLDDVLVCVAEGIIRRLKGTERLTVQLRISFEGDGDDKLSNFAKGNLKNYIRIYLERALYHLYELGYGNTPGICDATDELSILEQCELDVEISNHPKLETARDLAKHILKQNSRDDLKNNNIVPRPLFGTLCKQLHKEIRDGWLSRSGHENMISADSGEWEKLSSEDYRISSIEQDDETRIVDTPINNGIAADKLRKRRVQLISTILRHRVESIVTTAFAVADSRLFELGNKMDMAFLEGDEERNSDTHPMPEFGSDVDAIVDEMSAPFIALLEDEKSFTGPEREWVEAQRIHALKQVVGTGIHRLFHIHMQSLRDHFGHWYECNLDSLPANGLDTEGYSSQINKQDRTLHRQEAALQSEEGFRKAAFGSIPQICQHPEGELCDELFGMFSCVESLRELLEDMYEVTSTRGLEEEELEAIIAVSADDANNDSNPDQVGLRELIKIMKAKIEKRGPARWYERWAAKILIVGVNYVQGWILLQALRREARKRDLTMPKFPLF